MKLRRIVSGMMALLLAVSLPVSAMAAEYDLAQGSVTVNASESGQTVTHGSNDAVSDDAPVIIQSNNETPTSNTITINADAGTTANVTLDGVNIDVAGTGGYDPAMNKLVDGEAAVQITGNGDVTLELDGKNTVQSGYGRAGVEKNDSTSSGKLTITDENGTDGTLKATGGICGAGIGGGENGTGSNITITGSAEVTAQGGRSGSGIGGGFLGSGSDITIEGSAEVTAKGGDYGSGIGGGNEGSGSDITITDSAEVTAKGGVSGSGIGGGSDGSGSKITISEDAQVKAQGGSASGLWLAGAAIGNGGVNGQDGQDVAPNTDKLTANGKIEYYAPGANMETAAPTKTVTGTYVPPQPEEPVQPENPVQTAQPEEEAPQPAQPLYRVIGQDGKNLACKAEQKGGVLTITVDADFATLTGSFSGMKTLKAQGVDTIVFETNGAASTFAIADLLAQGATGDTYALTHVGSTVTLTLGNGIDISSILK